jgi:hyaluronan synthase
MAGAFAWLCFVAVLPHFHRDVASDPNSAERVAALRVTVIVPVMSEGTAMLRAMLDSLVVQTRLPQRIHVIENGTAAPTMNGVVNRWSATIPPGVEFAFDHLPTAGKRSAQAIAILADPEADIYATVDSDVVLEPTAMEYGLAPFARPTTMSVGGVLFGANADRNVLTRLVELGYACTFLNGRAAYSMLRSVNVQCGAMAWYRGWVWRKYLGHYLSHTVAGRFMQYGDDAMLTRYAAFEGEGLMQIGAVGRTLHPTGLAHLSRQRLRWWRSFFWGNTWLLRTIRPDHPLWWIAVINFVRFAWFSAALVVILLLHPVITGQAAWYFFAWLTGIAYLHTARYLTVRVPGRSFSWQLRTWALAPVMSLLNLYLGPALQLTGLLTCLRTGWSTRAQVDVELLDGDQTPKPSTGVHLNAAAASRRQGECLPFATT